MTLPSCANYDALLRFVRKTANLVEAAKTLTAWQWTVLLPGKYGVPPVAASNVPVVLNASCGWRNILLKTLFADVGISGRTVNFYNVLYQGNHTATELFIHTKWMFFDPTFGTYFESACGGSPLSIAEVRMLGRSRVLLKQSSLTGWTGIWREIDGLNCQYEVKSDSIFERPISVARVRGRPSGDVENLYFGPQAAYRIKGKDIPIPTL
jgi:hypothetical protein